MKFKLQSSSDQHFYFVLVARNGQILMTSETYTRKLSAQISIASINALFKKSIPVIDETK